MKAHDLITSPAFVVIKATNEFKDKPTRVNQQWQTDFTYFKIIGWGWHYLSTILDDYSRYVVSWKLCSTMKARDVTETEYSPGGDIFGYKAWLFLVKFVAPVILLIIFVSLLNQ